MQVTTDDETMALLTSMFTHHASLIPLFKIQRFSLDYALSVKCTSLGVHQ
jgi:hypothetical protein